MFPAWLRDRHQLEDTRGMLRTRKASCGHAPHLADTQGILQTRWPFPEHVEYLVDTQGTSQAHKA
eukprot:10548664-Alexandrium_andersonii.AAC.1